MARLLRVLVDELRDALDLVRLRVRVSVRVRVRVGLRVSERCP